MFQIMKLLQLNIKLVWMQVAAAIQAVQQIQSGPTMFPEKKIFRLTMLAGTMLQIIHPG
jgi:hypothetical protein